MITHLHIRAINACSSRGILIIGATQFPCRLGKTGRRFRKREGDGASPIGVFKLEQLYYRPDQMSRPRTQVKSKPLKVSDGWCDDSCDFHYNRHVNLPFAATHEVLWRADDAYNLVISTNHNLKPRVRGFGSAIFLHVTDGKRGTEGCIALTQKHLKLVLSRCSHDTRLVIWPNSGLASALFRK
jgi:L,D-peptidoglycan transpeptidase YkuD (ErfK/YbiS/YcfS/YnhG family)